MPLDDMDIPWDQLESSLINYLLGLTETAFSVKLSTYNIHCVLPS